MRIKSLYSYIGQTSEIRKAEAFWAWFTANKSNYLFLHQVDMAEKQRLTEAFMASLHLYNEHLFFEIGGHPGDTQLNLIITAEGVAAHFPAVELLTELAPELKDWNVIAFKPAFEGDFQLELPGRSFDPRNILVIPMHSEKDKDALGFQICYPEFTETFIFRLPTCCWRGYLAKNPLPWILTSWKSSKLPIHLRNMNPFP